MEMGESDCNLPECIQDGVDDSGHTGQGQPAKPQDCTPLTDPKQLPTQEFLKCSVQEIIADLNSKRKRDVALLEDFKKALDMHCTAAYNRVEAAVYNMYGHNNATIQEKVEQLLEVSERIAKHQTELEDFKGALAALYSDVQETEPYYAMHEQ